MKNNLKIITYSNGYEMSAREKTTVSIVESKNTPNSVLVVCENKNLDEVFDENNKPTKLISCEHTDGVGSVVTFKLDKTTLDGLVLAHVVNNPFLMRELVRVFKDDTNLIHKMGNTEEKQK